MAYDRYKHSSCVVYIQYVFIRQTTQNLSVIGVYIKGSLIFYSYVCLEELENIRVGVVFS